MTFVSIDANASQIHSTVVTKMRSNPMGLRIAPTIIKRISCDGAVVRSHFSIPLQLILADIVRVDAMSVRIVNATFESQQLTKRISCDRKAIRSLLRSSLAFAVMKSELFLLLPVGATVVNILFALQLNHDHSKVDAQPVINEAYIDRCADNSLGECFLSLDDYRKEDAENFEHDLVDPVQDPMLKLIPGTDFKAYVRADVATFYGQEPGSMKERTPSF